MFKKTLFHQLQTVVPLLPVAFENDDLPLSFPPSFLARFATWFVVKSGKSSSKKGFQPGYKLGSIPSCKKQKSLRDLHSKTLLKGFGTGVCNLGCDLVRKHHHVPLRPLFQHVQQSIPTFLPPCLHPSFATLFSTSSRTIVASSLQKEGPFGSNNRFKPCCSLA